jgi:SAM-dependent methyltransferase
MTPAEAQSLLATAIDSEGGVWADLGAGEGTFTRALASLLGADARIYAVERDAAAVESLKRVARATPAIEPVVADFSDSYEPPQLLDGILLANSLHYQRDAGDVLARLAQSLKPGGRVVLIEYDRRRANQWVPYPIAIASLPALAARAGLSAPAVVARRASIYQGELYVAIAERIKPGKF